MLLHLVRMSTPGHFEAKVTIEKEDHFEERAGSGSDAAGMRDRRRGSE